MFKAVTVAIISIVFFENCNGGTKVANNQDLPVVGQGDSPFLGKTIAFAKKESRMGFNMHHIFLMDLDKDGKGINVRALTLTPQPEDQPNWSPDGTKLTYMSGDGMWVVNADGSGQTLFGPVNPFCGANPSWSPDGTKYVYSKVLTAGCTDPGPGVIPNTEIRIMNTNGTNDHLVLASGGTFNVEPRWTIDNKIIFMSGRAGSQDAFSVNLDGTGLTQLTFSVSPGVGVAGDPFPSLNGKKISFGSNREGAPKLNIFSLDLLSNVITQLTFFVPQNGHTYEAGDTSWTTDGKWITFEYDIDGAGQSDDSAYAEVQIVSSNGLQAPFSTGQICTTVGCAPRFKP